MLPESVAETDIGFWGPTNAGKDWLIRAFARELELYNEIPENPKHFRFDLLTMIRGAAPGTPNLVPVPIRPPDNIPGTTRQENHYYEFQRVPLVDDAVHRLSAQTHRFVIHNEAGAATRGALTDPIAFEATYRNLRNSPYLFLVLDASIAKNTGNAVRVSSLAPLPPAERPDYDGIRALQATLENPQASSSEAPPDYSEPMTKNTYHDDLKKLLVLLSQSNQARPGLAVCMTKMDALDLIGEPWNLLEVIFGPRVSSLLRQYQSGFDIQVFSTSAAGHLYTRGQTISNIRGASLIDPEHWYPENVAAPFFWIFEKIERDRISQRKAKQKIIDRIFTDDAYVPYPRSAAMGRNSL